MKNYLMVFLIVLLLHFSAYGSNDVIITQDLSRIDVDSQEAAMLVKFNGPIDASYTIGEILVIISDGNIFAYGKGKKDRFVGNYTYKNIPSTFNNEDGMLNIEEKPKSIEVWNVPLYGDDNCNVLDYEGFYRCVADSKAKEGYYAGAINTLVNILAEDDPKINKEEIKEEICSLYKNILEDLSVEEKETYEQSLQHVERLLISGECYCEGDIIENINYWK